MLCYMEEVKYIMLYVRDEMYCFMVEMKCIVLYEREET
jgi:hypothetical protein